MPVLEMDTEGDIFLPKVGLGLGEAGGKAHQIFRGVT